MIFYSYSQLLLQGLMAWVKTSGKLIIVKFNIDSIGVVSNLVNFSMLHLFRVEFTALAVQTKAVNLGQVMNCCYMYKYVYCQL